ncbi:hypothetical protein BSLG_010729 [Batrachochytrium salamandrivorans]|nr:hypothetical protein BSLG_010729 [Batrachochytrium salamandrivorans]
MVAVSFVLVLALMSSTVAALPGTDDSTEILARFKRQPTPSPPKIFTESIHQWIPLNGKTSTPTSDEDPTDIGLSYILQRLNIQPDEFTRRTNFTDPLGVTHLYGMPLHKGLFIGNLHAAVHIKDSQVFFYSATTILDDHVLTKRSPPIPELTVEMSSEEAVKAAVDCLGIPFYPDIVPVKESYETDNGNIFVWSFHLRDNPTTQWVEVKVNAITERLLKAVFGGFDPTLQTPKNLVAGAINAFYVTNKFHDDLYQYGFTEPAGNFQMDNFGRGGIGGDQVIINVQGSERENYAIFDTPFDGRSGVLNLHIFTTTEPNRDPALDNNVMIHELTHGLSSRLTGGSRTKMCMSVTESRGLSEGYSDMMALIFMARPEDTRNTKKSDGRGEKNPYRIGEIWATMLLEVYWNLVEAYGFSANLHDATQKQGNIIFLQLFVGALMIQPCNPTFELARVAMLAADAVYYGGIHKHLIRKGFAKRSLGSISQLDPTMDNAV